MEARTKYLLLYLAEASDKQLSSFLKIADRGQILAIKEATLNLLLGHFEITEEEKRALGRHKRFLRDFAQKGYKSDLSRKAKIIKRVLKLAVPTLKGI